jgi:hypothetical protein
MTNVEYDYGLLPNGEQRSIGTTPTVEKLADFCRKPVTLGRQGASLGIDGKRVESVEKAIVPVDGRFGGAGGYPQIRIFKIPRRPVRKKDLIHHALRGI